MIKLFSLQSLWSLLASSEENTKANQTWLKGQTNSLKRVSKTSLQNILLYESLALIVGDLSPTSASAHMNYLIKLLKSCFAALLTWPKNVSTTELGCRWTGWPQRGRRILRIPVCLSSRLSQKQAIKREGKYGKSRHTDSAITPLTFWQTKVFQPQLSFALPLETLCVPGSGCVLYDVAAGLARGLSK